MAIAKYKETKELKKKAIKIKKDIDKIEDGIILTSMYSNF